MPLESGLAGLGVCVVVGGKGDESPTTNESVLSSGTQTEKDETLG
jgi:hypothetical protein